MYYITLVEKNLVFFVNIGEQILTIISLTFGYAYDILLKIVRILCYNDIALAR